MSTSATTIRPLTPRGYVSCRFPLGSCPLALWFPELDLVALGIQNPREAAVRIIVLALKYLDTLCAQPRNYSVHVVDSVVDHEGAGRWRKVVRRRRKCIPDERRRVLWRIVAQR